MTATPPLGAGGAAPPSGGGDRTRCAWATGSWLLPYHDEEWGVPIHDDRRHFEHLVLEGAQAGLSWLSVLTRHDGYRRAFADFDPAVVAGFGSRQVEALLQDTSLIRNRRKIESVVANAIGILRIQEEHGSFAAYLWERVGGQPVVNRWRDPGDVPPSSRLSAALSADLRRRGFRFVGPIVCYSHLQATGLVMDHLVTCFRHEELASMGPER